jgi:hypothetical protein
VSAYRLLWELLKHVLRGRGRDDVFLAIDWDLPHRDGSVTGEEGLWLKWESRRDGFGVLSATSKEGPWSEHGYMPAIPAADRRP